MEHTVIDLPHKKADGYSIPCKGFNIVMVATNEGFVGCGAFNVEALEKFDYPAACVRSCTDGAGIVTIDDLMDGIISVANQMAIDCGITVGMSAKEALEKL